MNSDSMDVDVPEAFAEALGRFLDAGFRTVASGCDYQTYLGTMHDLHASLARQVDPFPDWPQALQLARQIWRQTPNPVQGYARPPLPEPGRNEPCPCGSGRKYKHCCLPLAQTFAMPEINGLTNLLEALPRNRWAELPGSRVPLTMVESTALEWQEDGESQKAIALLEPWFRSDADFEGKRATLLDLLLESYDEAGHPRKKAQLLERAITADDMVIRSAAWQRQAAILADQGDYLAAWQAFTRAQRENPEDPSLAHLEVTILTQEGRGEEARERAKFWARRLEARHDPELAPAIEFLHDIGQRGRAAIDDKLIEMHPELEALSAALRKAPPVASHYTFDAGDTETGPLHPKPALRKALRAWSRHCGIKERSVFAMMHDLPDLHGTAADWLAMLQVHPVLWSAFEVLDTIVAGLQQQYGPAFTQSLRRGVLERAEELLHTVLRANAVEGKLFEWGWLENRPALHLLGDRIAMELGQPADDAQLARVEWILRLNPGDNQGFREELMRTYIERERFDDALAFAAKYPDDFGGMRYNRALALFAAGRKEEATTALRDAFGVAPKMAAWLSKANPKPPPQDDGYGVTVGGDEEAWLYRDATLDLWQRFHALVWLRTVSQDIVASDREPEG